MTPSFENDPILQVRDVSCAYGSSAVVEAVSLDAYPGEMVCIVGESGSGKSTLLRAIAGLHRPTAGAICLDGRPLAPTVAKRSHQLRRDIQLVFQNPDASLNPRHSIGRLIERPIRMFFPEMSASHRSERIAELLEAVRLDPTLVRRRPHELSGGQRQRVALARAFAARPRLLLCDEVVSALDVSVQAVVLDLLTELASIESTTVVFVTHDLGVVRAIAHRVVVLQNGVVREAGLADDVFAGPQHSYTRQLLASVPMPRLSPIQPVPNQPIPIKEDSR